MIDIMMLFLNIVLSPFYLFGHNSIIVIIPFAMLCALGVISLFVRLLKGDY